MASKRKDRYAKIAESLGASNGAAKHRLTRMLLFSMAKRLSLDICYRCSKQIYSVGELSIDHKIEWEGKENAKDIYFNLENIAFSHLSCNCSAARRPAKKYDNRFDKKKAEHKRRKDRDTAAVRLVYDWLS